MRGMRGVLLGMILTVVFLPSFAKAAHRVTKHKHHPKKACFQAPCPGQIIAVHSIALLPRPACYQHPIGYSAFLVPYPVKYYRYFFPKNFLFNSLYCLPRWMSRTDLSYGIQRFNKPVAALETIQPIYVGKRRTWFWQARFANSDLLPSGNFGLGFRYLGCNKQWMAGVNTFYNESIRRTHKTIGIGAEFYTPFVTLRGNFYDGMSGVRFVGNTMEQALTGFDYSIETPVPYVSFARFTAKGYQWRAANNVYMRGHSVNGGLASLRIYPVRQFEINAGGGHDNGKGSQAFISFSYYLSAPDFAPYSLATGGSSAALAARNLECLRLEKVRHTSQIVIQKNRNSDLLGVIAASMY